MSDLMRKATPGLAVAGAALATVWLFDPALHPEPDSTTSGLAGTSGSEATDEGPGQAAGGSADTANPDGDGITDEAPAASDCSSTSTMTGDAAMTRWGAVQVRAEVAADGTLCDVTAVAYPDGDRKSAEINARAIPTLDAQAAELGVQFQSISGATYTSEAYRQSLQSILDQM